MLFFWVLSWITNSSSPTPIPWHRFQKCCWLGCNHNRWDWHLSCLSHRPNLILNCIHICGSNPSELMEAFVLLVKPCRDHPSVYSCSVTVCVIRVYSKLQLISTNTSTDNIYQGKHVLFSLIVPFRAHCWCGPVSRASQSLGHHTWADEERIEGTCPPWLVNLMWVEWHSVWDIYSRGEEIQTLTFSLCAFWLWTPEHCPRGAEVERNMKSWRGTGCRRWEGQ